MKATTKSIEERKQEILSNPKSQEFLRKKMENAIRFFETADLSAVYKNDKKP
jgi:hypothetical protein